MRINIWVVLSSTEDIPDFLQSVFISDEANLSANVGIQQSEYSLLNWRVSDSGIPKIEE
jgi:hypothetical protein